jgi:RNA polymerase sigma-B factor
MDVRSEATGSTLLERLEDEDSQLMLTVDRVMVEEAIASLPEDKRRILHLRFNEDMTQSQIAEIVGISQMHVSRLLTSSLEELRASLDEENEK